MAAPQNFRSAFNGFNREDVVRYLEYINAKHASEINQLNSEADFLRNKLEGQHSAEDYIALEEERDQLLAQLEEMKARCEALEEELSNRAPAQPEANTSAEELEAYRRAERAERMAKTRVSQMYAQANAAIADTSANLDVAAENLGKVAQETMEKIQALQAAVTGSKQVISDAAAALGTIRPGTEEE